MVHVLLGSSAAGSDGRANFVDANGIDDWVFGVQLQSAAGRVWFHRDGHVVQR